ncbi:MAG: trypsin-like peptidase domain-containing protein [Syntrophorhabdales bacterium]|jgi:serine protease Do
MKRLLIPATALILFFPHLLAASEDRLVSVVDAASKAIVNIKTEEAAKRGSEARSTSLFRRFFLSEAEDNSETVENIGSGVVLDPKGIIVTNEHLISKATTIRVKFVNRQEYEAHVIAADPEIDIALLKVEDAKREFPFMKTCRGNARVGETAVVIGNPYDLPTSVTVGVVSALRRNVKINDRVYTTLIQTDAAINPGNSGGALLDSDGNLLGIVTAVYEEGKGIGFAIPIGDVLAMLSEFLEHAARRPIFGLFVDRRYDDSGQYLYVDGVIPGSPAEADGMRVGDRIIEIDNMRIREGMKFQNVFRNRSLNGAGRLKFVRGSATLVINDTAKSAQYVPSPLDERLCGVRVANIEGYARLKFKLRQQKGVVVTKVMKGGLGERYGIRAGDVIVRINNAEVPDRDRFNALMVEGLRRNYILYQVKRNEDLFFLPIKLDTLL